jgi:plastocyanin
MRTPSLLIATLLISVSACSSPPPASAPPAGGGKKVDAATAGTISGKVTFAGTPPKPDMLRMTTDQACVQASGAMAPSDAALVAADGAVQNTFVYIKDGVDAAYSFEVPAEAVVLDQKGCRYAPRVIGVRAGQRLEIANSDATLHNVHALPMTNQEFNHGQKEKDPNIVHTFTVPEVMVRFKCDVHGWMNAHVGVMGTPFFAVTAADGSYEIKGVPPGTYTVAVWHEKFGESMQSVTVGDRETKTAAFTFKQ